MSHYNFALGLIHILLLTGMFMSVLWSFRFIERSSNQEIKHVTKIFGLGFIGLVVFAIIHDFVKMAALKRYILETLILLVINILFWYGVLRLRKFSATPDFIDG